MSLNFRPSPDRAMLDVSSELLGGGAAGDTNHRQLCSHASWNTALAAALAASAKPGLVALIGCRGAGKSVLLQVIGRELAAAGSVVRAWDPSDPGKAEECDVLLLDDADGLSDDLLRKLARGRRVCFAAGSPKLTARLDPRAGRLTIVEIEAMSPKDARAFVERQLSALARSPEMLTEAGLSALYREAGGAPGPMLDLAGLAVFLAQLEGAGQVGVGHVAAATRSSHDIETADELEADEPAVPAEAETPAAATVAPVLSPPTARRARIALPALALLFSVIVLRSTGMPASDAPGATMAKPKPALVSLEAVSRAEAAEPEPFEALFASPAASGTFVFPNQGVYGAQQFGAQR